MKTVRLQDLMPLINEAFERGQTITIPVTGTSMSPTIAPGDAVTLRAIDVNDIARGDVLLYRRQNGQFVLHRVVDIHGDILDFCGDAQLSIECDVPKKDIIAQVISYEKNGREYKLETIRADGKRCLRTRPLRLALNVFCRTRDAKTTESDITPLRFIGRYLKTYLVSIIVLCVLSFASAVAMLGMAMASGRVIDKALYDDMHNFTQWFLLLFGLLAVICVCSILYSNLRIHVVGRMKNRIREDLFAILLTKRYRSVQNIHSGEILNRMTSDIQVVVEGAVTLIPQTFSLCTKLIGGIGFMMIIDPIFTSILIVCAVVFSILLHIFSRLYKKIHKECQETEGKTRSYLQECIENLVVIKSFINEKGVLTKLGDYQEDNYHKQVRRNLYASIGNTAIYFGFTVAYYAAMAWGVLRIAGVIGSEAPMLIGTFVTLLQIMEQIRSPFRAASGILPQFYAMLASAERLQELFMLPSEKCSMLSVSLQTIYQKLAAVQLKGVTFAYDVNKPVLQQYSVTFKKGTLTALVGSSGTGKTTLIKLLLGLIRPQQGKISLVTENDEIEVNAATRGLFAYVPQGNMILSGTIAENIAFGNRDVSQEAIMNAVKLACLEDAVAALSRGIDSVIGERGIGLSEGQIQRVAVARALLSNAPILLLDECTSALDKRTEKQLIENLKTLKERTIIFISHRSAVLENADEIVAMDDR